MVRKSGEYPVGALCSMQELQSLIDRAVNGEKIILYTTLPTDHCIGKIELNKSSCLYTIRGDGYPYIMLRYGNGHSWSLYNNAPVLPWGAAFGGEMIETFLYSNWWFAWADKLGRGEVNANRRRP